MKSSGSGKNEHIKQVLKIQEKLNLAELSKTKKPKKKKPKRTKSYLHASRTPFYGVLMTVPLLIFYEILALIMRHHDAEPVRNGIDLLLRRMAVQFGSFDFSAHWFQWLIDRLSFHGVFVLGILFVVLFGGAFYSFVKDRPIFKLQYCFLIILESGIYVWVLAIAAQLLTNEIVAHLALSQQTQAALMVSIGAGVFEELLFRALVYGVLTFLIIKLMDARRTWPIKPVMMLLSAFLFAWAHDLSELNIFDYHFMYRAIMGVLFCLLYEFRGLGVAVWTHALYDIAVIMVK